MTPDEEERISQIRARLEAAHATVPYEYQDRHQVSSAAWSELYRTAPDDLAWLLERIEDQ